MNAVNSVGRSCLMQAATSGHNPEVLRVLVRGGAHLEARDRDERTALLLSVSQNHLLPMTLMLLELGADPCLRDAMDESVLDYVEDKSHFTDDPEAFKQITDAAGCGA